MSVLTPLPHPDWYIDETKLVFAEFTTPATTLRKKQIDGALRQLKSGPISGSDIFAKMDMLQVYRAADSQAARVDWIDPTRTATLVNAPTFTAGFGFTTNGTNSYIDTGFNPGDGGSYNFTQNSAHFGVDVFTPLGTAGAHSGRWNGSNGTTIQQRQNGGVNSAGARVNQSTGTLVNNAGIITDGAYDLAINRDGSTSLQVYRQGAELTASSGGSASSTAVVNGTMLVGTINTSVFRPIEAHATYAGGSLTADEHADRLNAILSYEGNVDGALATRTDNFPLHAVRNAFDADGRHFVIAGNDELYVAEPGSTTYTLTYTFPDTPARIYGLFITSAGTVLVGTMDEGTGIKGRTYRSTNQGTSFTQITTFDAGFRSGNANFWGMTEDGNGDLYAGQYTVDSGAAAVLQCKAWKSTDDGVNWTDVSDPTWTATNHVHSVAIDPSTGWLYATLGDVNGYDGVWRSKLKDGSDWVRKTADDYQYIPLEFDGTYVYTADDQQDATVVRFIDDGTSSAVVPTVVLDGFPDVNCYYVRRDPNGIFWACIPPTDIAGGSVEMAGAIYVSKTGAAGEWYRIFRLPVMPYTDWNNSAVDGSTSRWSLHTGTTQFGPQARNIFPALNYEAVRVWLTD